MMKIITLNGLKKKFKQETNKRTSEIALLNLKEHIETKIDETIDLAKKIAQNSNKKTIQKEHIVFAEKKILNLNSNELQ